MERLQECTYNLMNTMVDEVTYESLANKIVTEFARMYNAELCTLWRLTQLENQNILTLSAGLGVQLRPGIAPQTYFLPEQDNQPNADLNGVTIWIAVRKQPCLANSYQELKNDPQKPWYGAHRGKWDEFQFAGQGFQNLLGLPITYNGKLIAVLKIESTRSKKGFSQKDLKLGMELAPFVAIELQAMDQRERHEQQRQSVIRSLTESLLHKDLSVFYQEVVDRTAELLNADICTMWLVDNDRRKLRVRASHGFKGTSSPEYDLNWDAKDDTEINGLTPWVVIRGRSFFGQHHKDLSDHPSWRGVWDPDQWGKKPMDNFGCLYAVPLLDVKNKTFGVLKIENRAGKPAFSTVYRALFDWVADFVALALEYNYSVKSDIVYEFFHLLRQPVASAITAFDLLRRELNRPDAQPEDLEECLDIMAKNLQTVRIWTINVYGIATRRVMPGEKPTMYPILELLKSAVDSMRIPFPDFPCEIVCEPDLVLSLTSLQKKQFDAIIYNLLDNSYKYSENPRIIRAAVSQVDHTICLTISDNGRGIAPEDLPHVFEANFSRGVETWPTSLGLGLSTVDRLLKQLGWTYQIESQVGQGTQFTIKIPAKE